MLTLQFELEFQKINLVNRWETVATDSKNYLVARFSTISDDWTTPITAIFTNDKDEQPYAVVVGADSTLESNECYVPWEVLKDESNVYVSAYCGNLHTTVTAQFHVYKSGYADGEIPPPPSPTVYDAIMQAITNLQNGKQDKLTAGENITISDDNVISAEGGGVTSYNDLTDLPEVSNYAPSQQKQIHQLIGTLDLYPFISSYDSSTKKNSLRLDVSNLFEAFKDLYTIYNFEDLPTSHGVFACYYANSGYIKPLPDFMKPQYNFFIVYNLYTGQQGLAQVLFWVDRDSGESKTAFRVGTGNFYSVSDWVELTGGSQIVSGVVNANGTITFTDSDGNTFTTTGSSVIGEDGFSPVATVTQTASGATVSITDKNGTTTANIANGQDGNDYVLTAQDKSDIANIVLSELPTTQGVLYGNTSN